MDADGHIQLANALLPAVLAAGRLEMGYFETGCLVETKADRSPVTIADQRAEALLIEALAAILPGVPVVAEEAFAAGARPAIGNRFILVDALDGTKQFVSGYREFTINVAVIEQGRPVFGLVYAPALDDLMVTAGPARALRARIAPANPARTLDDALAQPVGVRRPPEAGLIALQSRSRDRDRSDAFLASYRIGGRRHLGSSYKFCLIAAGEADIYPQTGDTNEWDTAAGEAVLLAAGGHVASLAGEALVYGKSAHDYRNPTFVAASTRLDELPRAGGH